MKTFESVNDKISAILKEIIENINLAKTQTDSEKEFKKTLSNTINLVHELEDIVDRKSEIGRLLMKLYDFFIYDFYRVSESQNIEELGRVQGLVEELNDIFEQLKSQ